MTDTQARLTSALIDRYRLERELGQGGMATVYLAEDLKHGRKVAIKVLHPELSAVIGGDRFLAEIKTTASLQHPHILGLIDSGEADGLLYYVMPFIEGETLRGRLTREKQLPIEDAVRLAKEVASALEFAHKRGIVHRDIKPENILIQDGQALVADFGIALAVQQAGGSRMTQTGMSLGTPAYMSPEQAMGERELGARSDVYALGAMTYEMLTGEPPFTGPNSQAIVAKVLTEQPPPLRPKRPSVPAAVEHAVLVALQKLPADRFGTAKDFADALDGKAGAYAATIITPGARPSGASRLSRPVLLAACALSMIAAGAAGWLLHRTPPAPVNRYSMGLPPSQAMRQGVLGVNLAFSPDGRRFVYIGPGEGGDQLWLRERDRLDATPLPGTVGAPEPVLLTRRTAHRLLRRRQRAAEGRARHGRTAHHAGFARGGLGRRRNVGLRRLDLLRLPRRPEPDSRRWRHAGEVHSAGFRRARDRPCLAHGPAEPEGPGISLPPKPRSVGLRPRRLRLRHEDAARTDQGAARALRGSGLPRLPARRRSGARRTIRPGQAQA